jgi:hypothetical protein
VDASGKTKNKDRLNIAKTELAKRRPSQKSSRIHGNYFAICKNTSIILLNAHGLADFSDY